MHLLQLKEILMSNEKKFSLISDMFKIEGSAPTQDNIDGVVEAENYLIENKIKSMRYKKLVIGALGLIVCGFSILYARGIVSAGSDTSGAAISIATGVTIMLFILFVCLGDKYECVFSELNEQRKATETNVKGIPLSLADNRKMEMIMQCPETSAYFHQILSQDRLMTNIEYTMLYEHALTHYYKKHNQFKLRAD